MEQERTLALALCRVEGIGAVSIRKLLEKAGDVSEIRKLPAESLQKLLGEKKAAFLKNWDAPENLELAKRQEEQWKKKGISFDFLWEEAFPKRLKEISDPPLVLYRIGKLPEPEKKMTAIVGARACSSYGKEMAEYFARGLAKEGIGIVSGMARGRMELRSGRRCQQADIRLRCWAAVWTSATRRRTGRCMKGCGKTDVSCRNIRRGRCRIRDCFRRATGSSVHFRISYSLSKRVKRAER